jgi:methyl coenzyme M reductase subunit D
MSIFSQQLILKVATGNFIIITLPPSYKKLEGFATILKKFLPAGRQVGD